LFSQHTGKLNVDFLTTQTLSMLPLDLAIARRRAYYLFGRLFLEGVTPELLPQLEAVPELAEAAQPYDSNMAAAEHYQLTAVDVFPYESIFLDPTGLLGGPVSNEIAEAYNRSGYETLSDYDHLGHELGFLAHLCGMEAASIARNSEEAVVLWTSRQQSFLAGHLLRWLSPLVVAVQQSGNLFYGLLTGLILDLCVDNLQGGIPNASLTLPQPPQIGGQESSLKDIARVLTTPPYSGLFLSRDAISALARRHELPRGFGDRAQTLTNLLRTAGQYDAAGAVFLDLAGIFQEGAERYEQQHDQLPKLQPWLKPWIDRVTQTAESLESLMAVLEENNS
jgi:TorA maturation chaperone TorD